MSRLSTLQHSLQEIDKQIASLKGKYTPFLSALRKKRKSLDVMYKREKKKQDKANMEELKLTYKN